MITKTKTKKSEYFAVNRLPSTSVFVKKILLTMAKNKKSKPSIKTNLGQRFYSYIYVNSDCYDSVFVKKIRSINPGWLLTQTDLANQKKQKLLLMAKNGEPRPNKRNHSLGTSLGSYTNKSQGLTYDPEFTSKIKKLRPDWFISQSEKADKKRKKILELAVKGKPKPSFKTVLGRFISEQTTKSESKNCLFSKKLRKLRPDWFITRSDIANLKKEKLLTMAKLGAKKPLQKTKLGTLLYSYIRTDLAFKNAVKKLRPDWFVKRLDIAKSKKKKILQIARQGLPRMYDKLGCCLCNYVSKGSGSYDPVFSSKIKKIRPDWFRK